MARHLYEFGPYTLDVLTRRLTRDGEPVTLTPKALDALVALVEHRDRVLGKAELMKQLWPDSYVEEANLTQTIFMLRKALGEAPGGRQYIDTVPRRGYRFAARVRETREGIPGPAAPTGSARWIERVSTRRAIVAVIVMVGGLVAGAVYYELRGRHGADAAATTARSIAVLPFQRLGPAAADDEYLGLGMADALITQLGNLRRLTVRPTAAVKPYVNPNRDPALVGRALGVEWVLDGRIQRAGDRLRASVQLIRVSDGVPAWADRFDVAWTDIFTVQDRIAAEVARALTVRLSNEEQRQLARRYTRSAEAHELYLKSRYFWNKRTGEGYVKAIEYAERAIAQDPAFALAHASLADSYALLGSMANRLLPRDVAMRKAKDAATKALELDDSLAEAHTSLAFVLMHHDWNWRQAEREFVRAIELNPDYPTAHHRYAYHLVATGRPTEALDEIKRAQALDPLSLIINTDVAEVHFYARRYDEAISLARKVLEMDDEFALVYQVLTFASLQKGDYRSGLAAARRASELREDLTSLLAYSYARAGDHAKAREALRRFEAARPYGVAYTQFETYAALGETDRAFTYLEQAYAERSGSLILLDAEPRFGDEVRADPRFRAVLRRMGLAP